MRSKIMPWVHFVLAVFFCVFMSGQYWQQVMAYDGRISAVEVKVADIAVMKQEIHDVWRAMGLNKHE